MLIQSMLSEILSFWQPSESDLDLEDKGNSPNGENDLDLGRYICCCDEEY